MSYSDAVTILMAGIAGSVALNVGLLHCWITAYSSDRAKSVARGIAITALCLLFLTILLYMASWFEFQKKLTLSQGNLQVLEFTPFAIVTIAHVGMAVGWTCLVMKSS